MENFLVLLVVVIAIYMLMRRGSKKEKESFIASLPTGFGYAYYCKCTGFAVNPIQNEIIIRIDGKNRIYSKGKIRNIRYNIATPDRIVGTGLNVASHQVGAALAAARATGIFFELADIEYPEIKVFIKDKKGAQRNFEILQQFMDGILEPYDKYMARNNCVK